MKELVVGGCSFTEHTSVSYKDNNLKTDFPRWPEHLANKLNLKPVNLGHSGCGNDLISKRVSRYILENHKKIGFVAVLWSDWTRYSFLNADYMHLNPELIGKTEHLPHGTNFDQTKTLTSMIDESLKCFPRWKFEKLYEGISSKNILQFLQVELLCQKYQIQHLFMQGIMNIQESLIKVLDINKDTLMSKVLEYEDYFDSEKFIGWPCFYELGGTDYYNLSKNLTADKRFISNEDFHPSEQGHILIAETYHEHV